LVRDCTFDSYSRFEILSFNVFTQFSRAPSRSRSRSKDELLYISENEGDNEKTKRLKREMRGAQVEQQKFSEFA